MKKKLTTREIYFKNVVNTGLPQGLVSYVYKDKDNIIHPYDSISLSLSTEESIVIESIERMEEVEKSDGFMFWTLSQEGEEFFEINKKEFNNLLSKIILNQK
jgi:hypothetical protein